MPFPVLLPRRPRCAAGLALLLLLGACQERQSPSIGVAYVGPMEITLRGDIKLQSMEMGKAKHGEKVEILQIRRRFLKVRAGKDVEGWIEGEKLLTADQMKRLDQVSQAATQLPKLGEGLATDLLNVHTEPNRLSPSFYTLQPGETYAIVGHKIAPREPFPAAIIRQLQPPTRPVAPRKKKKKEEKQEEPEYELPFPKPPSPPSRWIEMSKVVFNEEAPEGGTARLRTAATGKGLPETGPVAAPNAPKVDDWVLVVTPEKKAGWVLTSRVTMNLPEDVIGYAQGARVMAFWEIGEVATENGTKKNYLWLVSPRGGLPFDFTGMRVLVYSPKKKAYLIMYREKEMEGYFPAAVQRQTVVDRRGAKDLLTFLIVSRNRETGELERRTFAFESNMARVVERVPWKKLEDPLDYLSAQRITKPYNPDDWKKESVWDEIKRRLPFLSDQ